MHTTVRDMHCNPLEQQMCRQFTVHEICDSCTQLFSRICYNHDMVKTPL